MLVKADAFVGIPAQCTCTATGSGLCLLWACNVIVVLTIVVTEHLSAVSQIGSVARSDYTTIRVHCKHDTPNWIIGRYVCVSPNMEGRVLNHGTLPEVCIFCAIEVAQNVQSDQIPSGISSVVSCQLQVQCWHERWVSVIDSVGKRHVVAIAFVPLFA